MVSRNAPLTGFGNAIDDPDGTADNVFFAILAERESIPQWESSPIIQQFNIPGSLPPVIEEELIGWTPATVTWRLQLGSIADFRRLATMVTTRQTLTVKAGIQVLPVRGQTSGGVSYDILEETTLLGLAGVVKEIGGGVLVNATFQRIIDPETGELPT